MRREKSLIWLLVFIYPFNSANLGHSTMRSYSTNITNHQFDFRFIYLKNPDIYKYWDTTCKWRTGVIKVINLVIMTKKGAWMHRMYLRRIIQQTTSSMERTDEGESWCLTLALIWRTWIITWILQVKLTRAESQLNLALEKSISGCWAMNLQTHKSHKQDDMLSPKQEQVWLLFLLIIFQTNF